MPIMCENSTKIEGKKEMVLDCLRAIGNGDTDSEMCFDFDKILPMPEEFKEIEQGNRIIDGEQVKYWKKVDGKEIAISKSEINRLKKKYGSFGWYDWSINNWGTKWGPSETFARTYNLDENYGVHIDYDTPWCTAEGILSKLQADWPELNIRTKWREYGVGEEGLIKFNPDGSYHSHTYTKQINDW